MSNISETNIRESNIPWQQFLFWYVLYIIHDTYYIIYRYINVVFYKASIENIERLHSKMKDAEPLWYSHSFQNRTVKFYMPYYLDCTCMCFVSTLNQNRSDWKTHILKCPKVFSNCPNKNKIRKTFSFNWKTIWYSHTFKTRVVD